MLFSFCGGSENSVGSVIPIKGQSRLLEKSGYIQMTDVTDLFTQMFPNSVFFLVHSAIVMQRAYG